MMNLKWVIALVLLKKFIHISDYRLHALHLYVYMQGVPSMNLTNLIYVFYRMSFDRLHRKSLLLEKWFPLQGERGHSSYFRCFQKQNREEGETE